MLHEESEMLDAPPAVPAPEVDPRRVRRVRLIVGGLAAARGVGGHLVLPLIVVVRGVPFLGLVLVKPNEATLAVGSAQASAGRLSWTALFVAAVIGAVASDGLSYALGRTLGEAALSKVTGSRHGHRVAPMIERSRRMIERRGVIAVAAARPTIVSHGVTPILAGIGGLKASRFIAAATVGASVWAATWLGGAAVVVDMLRRGPSSLIVGGVVVVCLGGVVFAVRECARRPACLGAAPNA